MIIRKNTDLDFKSQIENILEHPTMSLKSKGLLIWVLSMPDNFVLTGKEVAKHNRAYPISIYPSFDELESLGYIKSNTQDKIIPNDEKTYIVYDSPQPVVSIQHKIRLDHERKMSDATNLFIKQYLRPNKHFKRNESISKIYDRMIHPYYPVEWDQICDYILDSLTYDEFLSTEYWEIISYYIKITRNFTCEKCGKKYNIMSKLNVHHKTYSHHGEEHKPEVIENDLELLCENCPDNFHKRLDKLIREGDEPNE